MPEDRDMLKTQSDMVGRLSSDYYFNEHQVWKEF